MAFISRFFTPGRDHFFLLGPRGMALKNFADDYPQSQRYLVYRGKERFKRDAILCLPAEEFLLGLRPGKFQP